MKVWNTVVAYVYLFWYVGQDSPEYQRSVLTVLKSGLYSLVWAVKLVERAPDQYHRKLVLKMLVNDIAFRAKLSTNKEGASKVWQVVVPIFNEFLRVAHVNYRRSTTGILEDLHVVQGCLALSKITSKSMASYQKRIHRTVVDILGEFEVDPKWMFEP